MKRLLFILCFVSLLIGCEKEKTACYQCKTSYRVVLDSMWGAPRYCTKTDTVCGTAEEIELHEQTNTFENMYYIRIYDLTHYRETGDLRITDDMAKDSLVPIRTTCNCEEIVE